METVLTTGAARPPSAMGVRPRSSTSAYVALAAVCFFWGTTYVAIRMALESFPPFALVAIRFLISGSAMLIGARLMGVRLPAGRELWTTAATGVLLLGGANTTLVIAETLIPSGLAALIIVICPFWLVGIEAAMPGGEPLHRPAIGGMLVGLAGAALLLSADFQRQSSGSAVLQGFLLLQLSNACWAFGSVCHRRQSMRAHPIVSGAVQQLAAGIAVAPLALLFPSHPIVFTFRGVAALLYLVVFGSIVGYSAYIYALSHLPVTVLSIYPYVNPVVAVILGWLFYREAFGAREAVAMVVIFAGVALVKRYSPAPKH
ncbi:MAG TPA: EamA family transporter [Bryobacteraceae bacterium]|nr:EamA family transporter [Bryobacteraceae bacterium]